MASYRPSLRELAELDARDFWGDEFWLDTKRFYDSLMAYRKSIKGKPDQWQRVMLHLNEAHIYSSAIILFHSAHQARYDRCGCPYCAKLRARPQEKE
jgi:hypothetical protein